MSRGDESGETVAYYFENIIMQIPTIDPVKHGRWEEREVVNEIDSSTAINEWQVARCSVCRKDHTTPYLYYFTDYEYCPWCGAKMDEVSE